MSQPKENIVSHGVDELIERLRNEGVEAGESQAEAIISAAKSKAKKIVDDARQDAEQRIKQAQAQASAFQQAAESALTTAMRDMVLELKSDLTREFSQDLQRLVSDAMLEPELLKRLILAVAGQSQAVADNEPIEIILPDKVVGVTELRNDPSILTQGPLSDLVFGITHEVLKKGVTFASSEQINAGIQIRLIEKDVVLDLTDQAVAELLLAHVQPRFRVILEGVVR